MKFQPHDIVRRVLPSGTMVGGLMVVIASTHNKYTTVRDVVTGKCYIYIGQIVLKRLKEL